MSQARNPAQRSLPFGEDPSFARAVWRLARAVPIVKGDDFHALLLKLATCNGGREVGLYTFISVYPYLESTYFIYPSDKNWFQNLLSNST